MEFSVVFELTKQLCELKLAIRSYLIAIKSSNDYAVTIVHIVDVESSQLLL